MKDKDSKLLQEAYDHLLEEMRMEEWKGAIMNAASKGELTLPDIIDDARQDLSHSQFQRLLQHLEDIPQSERGKHLNSALDRAIKPKPLFSPEDEDEINAALSDDELEAWNAAENEREKGWIDPNFFDDEDDEDDDYYDGVSVEDDAQVPGSWAQTVDTSFPSGDELERREAELDALRKELQYMTDLPDEQKMSGEYDAAVEDLMKRIIDRVRKYRPEVEIDPSIEDEISKIGSNAKDRREERERLEKRLEELQAELEELQSAPLDAAGPVMRSGEGALPVPIIDTLVLNGFEPADGEFPRWSNHFKKRFCEGIIGEVQLSSGGAFIEGQGGVITATYYEDGQWGGTMEIDVPVFINVPGKAPEYDRDNSRGNSMYWEKYLSDFIEKCQAKCGDPPHVVSRPTPDNPNLG